MLGLVAPAAAQEQLERALLRMPPVMGQAKQYQRKGKESIFAIARRYGVSGSAIHNANEGDLTAGDEQLLIPTKHIAPLPYGTGIVVNLPERNLYLYQEGRPTRCYPIAIGQRGWETPTGDFTIVNKRKNPTWFPPKWALEEEPVPPGPDNPLGDRWLGLSAPGYGVHATNAPASVGRYVSHGCLRMYPEHAHELYTLAPVETAVSIIYQRAVVGYRPEEGIVYLSYYPDPYDLGEVTPEQVRALLRDYGLDQVVDMSTVTRILQRTSGVPTPVVGSHTQLNVNGKPLRFALAPTPVGSDWLVPAGPLVGALGAEMEVGPGANYVVISRGGQRIFLSPGNPEALVNGELLRLEAAPQLAAGYPMIPVRATVAALGASLGWEEQAQTLLVWDAWERTNGQGWPGN
jgi:L,D-transpeptidase ErfK/SrfK